MESGYKGELSQLQAPKEVHTTLPTFLSQQEEKRFFSSPSNSPVSERLSQFSQ